MASIRVEDEARKDPRFTLLGKRMGTSRFDARGRMEELWAYCTEKQTYHLDAEMIDVLAEFDGFAKLIVSSEIGLAEATDKGIRIKGTKGRIEWLKKWRNNGKKGGRPKKPKEKPGGFENETQVEPTANLTLTITPTVPSTSQKKEIYIPPEQLQACVEEWQKTLDRYEIRKSASLEAPKIASLIHRFGFELILQCLAGYRFEDKSEKYNPAKNAYLHRLEKLPNRERLSALGAQNAARTRKVVETEVPC